MYVHHAAHAVYDTQYHLVWTPKYRKAVLMGAVGVRLDALLREISTAYEVEVTELYVGEDHMHLFCSFPPRDSIAQVISRFKSLSGRALFREFPFLKQQLWGGQLWGSGYFVRTVGDDVTAASVIRYIQNHRVSPDAGQLDLFGL